MEVGARTAPTTSWQGLGAEHVGDAWFAGHQRSASSTRPAVNHRPGEAEPSFAEFIENVFFARLTRELLGANALLYRSVLWNKAPSVGMAVPWHQDDGRFGRRG